MMERPHDPRLIGIGGPVEGGIFALADEEISIGRDHSNHLPIDDPSVSRRHCTIRRLAAERFEIRDLGSRNGTAVNGLPIAARVLRDRDEIRLGDCHFLFLLLGSNEPPNFIPVELSAAELDTKTLVRLSPEGSHLTLQPLLDEYAAHPRVSSSLAVLFKIGTGIQMARGTEEIARHVLESLFEVVPAGRGAVLLFDLSGDQPAFAYSRNRAGSADAAMRVDSPLVAWTRRERTAALATRPHAEGSSRCVLVAPIGGRDTILGVIYLEASDPRAAFDLEHLELVAAIGGILGAPLETSRRLEWLEAESRRLQEAISIEHDLVGGSPPMLAVFQLVAKVAPTDSTVMIRGESGTGKELVARAIHRNSLRAAQPFVAINCAALSETLLESELFGHERGAFTGAVAQKRGKLEVADRGTVFLDEVGELPVAAQTKLLRVLQEREFERVGGTRPIRVDVRLIGATNRDLESAVAGNTFRNDLYYRLNVVSLTIPPLRERRDDIPLLARYFAAKHGKRARRRVEGLSAEALVLIEAYGWPGNVRELENAIERAVVLGSTGLIVPEDLPETVLEGAPVALGPSGGYHQSVKEEKKRAILDALNRAGGNYTEAARLLGVHPNYLHRLVRNLGLKGETGKASGE